MNRKKDLKLRNLYIFFFVVSLCLLQSNILAEESTKYQIYNQELIIIIKRRFLFFEDQVAVQYFFLFNVEHSEIVSRTKCWNFIIIKEETQLFLLFF